MTLGNEGTPPEHHLGGPRRPGHPSPVARFVAPEDGARELEDSVARHAGG